MREIFKRWLAPTASDPEQAHKQLILNVLLSLVGAGALIYPLVEVVLFLVGRSALVSIVDGLLRVCALTYAYRLTAAGSVTRAGQVVIVSILAITLFGALQHGIGHSSIVAFAVLCLIATVLLVTRAGGGVALLTLINDILDFSKIESGKLDLEMVPFDLGDCLEDTLELLAVQAGKKGIELAGRKLSTHSNMRPTMPS